MTFSEQEIRAVEGALPAVGQHVATAGIGAKTFNDLTREEALALVANTVRAFRGSLHEIFDAEDIPF